MNLFAPAKTFLIGEYVATTGGPAIVLATQPSFSLAIDEHRSGLENIHPDSPAGLWYSQQDNKPVSLSFSDPYQGMGGLGASSAQFVLVYQAVKQWQKQAFDAHTLLSDYHRYAWRGEGIRPSGYDVLTQYAGHNLFIDDYGKKQLALNWPFSDYSLLLIHTGNKLSTHLHLAEQKQPFVTVLQPIVSRALTAWQQVDISGLADAIQAYHRELREKQLVAPHTNDLVQEFDFLPGVIAAKGCGALGADVLLLLVESHLSYGIQQVIKEKRLTCLATIDIFS